jgi:hypothetical protein
MSSQDVISASASTQDQDVQDQLTDEVEVSDHPPLDHRRGWQKLSPFWQIGW